MGVLEPDYTEICTPCRLKATAQGQGIARHFTRSWQESLRTVQTVLDLESGRQIKLPGICFERECSPREGIRGLVAMPTQRLSDFLNRNK